jgi:hypothetical protein
MIMSDALVLKILIGVVGFFTVLLALAIRLAYRSHHRHRRVAIEYSKKLNDLDNGKFEDDIANFSLHQKARG